MLPPAILQAIQARVAPQATKSSTASKGIRARLKTAVRTKAPSALALLARAKLLAPTVSALQHALQVTPAVLRDWSKNGVPKDQLPALRRVVVDYAAAQKQAADNLKQQAELLKRALQFASNPVGLSRALMVQIHDVFGWVKIAGKKPLAPVVQQALHRYVTTQQNEAERKAEQRKVFKQLMRLARRSKDEKGRPLVPKFKRADKARVGPRTIGWTWTKLFNAELSPQLLDDIDVWITSRPDKGFAHWQAIAHVTQFGGNKMIGYQRGGKPGPKQLGHDREGEFATDTELGGRVFDSKEAARGDLLGEMEAGDEEGIFIFVHAVAVNTFTRRTDEQRRAWETERRKERARIKRSQKTQRKKQKTRHQNSARQRITKPVPRKGRK